MSYGRWAEQVEFERRIESEGGHGTCDSCLMLPEVFDRLVAVEHAARVFVTWHESEAHLGSPVTPTWRRLKEALA